MKQACHQNPKNVTINSVHEDKVESANSWQHKAEPAVTADRAKNKNPTEPSPKVKSEQQKCASISVAFEEPSSSIYSKLS